VSHAWVRALVPSTGAAAALALGGVCAVLAVMGAMKFGLWEIGDRSGGGAMALPRGPGEAHAPARDGRAVRADARRPARPSGAARRRAARRAHETTVVVARPTAPRRVSAPSPQSTPSRPAEQATPSPATQERAAPALVAPPSAPTHVATPVADIPVPRVPPPGGSLPDVVRDVSGTAGRTTEAALGSVGRTAETAQTAVREVAEPATAPVANAVPAPARPAVTGVVAGVLGSEPPPP
jgi:hypothetical protein